MKVLDEKGRLFGKINFIDLLVVLMLVVVVLAVTWKLAGNRVTAAIDSEKQLPAITYEVLCTNVNNDVCAYAETLVDDQLMASGKMLDGYITAVSTEPYYMVCVDADGNPVNARDPQNSCLRFTISCNTPMTEYAYALGTQELRVGKNHIVKTCNLEVTGTITAMEVTPAHE